MGTTKISLYTAEQIEMSSLLKAIAHPARIAILEYLIKVDACICGDIVNELPLAQPTVSQHLKEMRNAGIIKGNVEGTAICYCVDKAVVARIQSYFSAISLKLDRKTDDSCC